MQKNLAPLCKIIQFTWLAEQGPHCSQARLPGAWNMQKNSWPVCQTMQGVAEPQMLHCSAAYTDKAAHGACWQHAQY